MGKEYPTRAEVLAILVEGDKNLSKAEHAAEEYEAGSREALHQVYMRMER